MSYARQATISALAYTIKAEAGIIAGILLHAKMLVACSDLNTISLACVAQLAPKLFRNTAILHVQAS